MSKNQIIEQYYEELNYPSLAKLFKAIRVHHKNISNDEVKQYLESLNEVQIFKPQAKINKKIQGHITSLSPNEAWQMDLLDLSKYSQYNKGFNFILLVIDIFTRKAYAVASKTKSTYDVIIAFETILNEANDAPMTITSDNESAFLSNDFEQVLDKYHIILEPNVKNDHNALGIIDYFCKRIRLVISKSSARSNNKYDWITALSKHMKNYNNAPNTAIEDISPNNATTPEAREIIFEKNLTKSKSNRIVSDLTHNDNVRIRIANQYTKSSEPQFSDDVYKVVSAKGKNITLNTGLVIKRANLLKVGQTATKQDNIFKTAHKEKKQRTVLTREEIKPDNVVIAPRIRRKRILHDV